MLKRSLFLCAVLGMLLVPSTNVFAFERADEFPNDFCQNTLTSVVVKDETSINAIQEKNFIENEILDEIANAKSQKELEPIMLKVVDYDMHAKLVGERYDEITAALLQKLTGDKEITFKDKRDSITYREYMELRYPEALAKIDTFEKSDVLDNWLNYNIFTIFIR